MSKQVLYVEDDYHNYLLVERILAVLPEVTVTQARTGDEALRLAREAHPDLILMDIHLPRMDGLELTRSLRAEDTLSDIPILALTANVMKGERERALRAGCNDFVAKPFKIREFRRLVADYLGISPGR